jgi:hypothetical protein
VPGALGLDSKTVAGAAGKGFDKAFPPKDQEGDELSGGLGSGESA